MFLKIPRLYDSHTHFLGTGQIDLGLRLHNLTSAQDIQKIEVKPNYFRGEWLFGFGWDQNNWPDKSLPTKEILDKAFPDFPVFLSRADGHTSWLNSKALEKLGMLGKNTEQLPDPEGGKIYRDAQGFPSGVLTEAAHMAAFEKLPAHSIEQLKVFLKRSVEIFNQAGFTHVRDLSCTTQQWQAMSELVSENQFTIALEAHFTAESILDIDRAIADTLNCKKTESAQLRAKGIKVFYDGSLGSETALLSKPYHGKDTGNKGIVTWSLQDIEAALLKTWNHKLEFSVHTIGDQAVHDIAELARRISAAGNVGRLNFEHAQMVRPETIKLMKPLHVRCYMQPCHWLSDRRWLKEKLADLYSYVFPWEALRLAQIPISFGSDSPIERPSLFDNIKALEGSANEGVKAFRGKIEEVHSYPDSQFAPSETTFQDGELTEIVFMGQKIFSKKI